MNFLLIVHHVQKSGGTSIIEALKKNKIKQSKNSPIKYSNIDHCREELFNCGEFIWNEPGIYGLHKKINIPCKYIIPIRDPIDRAISYLHQSCVHSYPLTRQKNVELSLNGWSFGKPLPDSFWRLVELDIDSYMINNAYLRSLVGKFANHIALDNKDLEIAIEILEKNNDINFIFQNCFEASFSRAMAKLELNITWDISCERRITKFDYKTNICSNFMEKIKEKNQLDIQLYNYIITKFYV